MSTYRVNLVLIFRSQYGFSSCFLVHGNYFQPVDILTNEQLLSILQIGLTSEKVVRIRGGSRKFKKGRWDTGQLLRCFLLLWLLILRITWEFFKNVQNFTEKRSGRGPLIPPGSDFLIPQMWMWFSEQFVFICEICLFLLRYKQREKRELESNWLGNSSKGLLACLLVPWQWNLKTIRQWASMWVGSYLQKRKYWLNSECEARRNLSKTFAAFVL